MNAACGGELVPGSVAVQMRLLLRVLYRLIVEDAELTAMLVTAATENMTPLFPFDHSSAVAMMQPGIVFPLFGYRPGVPYSTARFLPIPSSMVSGYRFTHCSASASDDRDS